MLPDRGSVSRLKPFFDPSTATSLPVAIPRYGPAQSPVADGCTRGRVAGWLHRKREVDDERLAELAAGNAAFALDLHRQLAGADGGNQFLSPYSVSTALAMTYAGAAGRTREQMRETLRYTLDDGIHAAFD